MSAPGTVSHHRPTRRARLPAGVSHHGPTRRPHSSAAARARDEQGQALLVLVAAICVACVAALVLGAVARGIGGKGSDQRVADLAALGGARKMHASYERLFAPALLDGRPNPAHLERVAYLAQARERALATARLNGGRRVDVTFPDGATFAPTRIRVSVRDPAVVTVGGHRRAAPILAVAEAQLAPMTGGTPDAPGAGDYPGPFAYRQGKPMRPDVALAFDRLDAAAAKDGIALTIASAFRSSAEQARLFAAHPDPKWVAPPGHSLHRLGTELDLGPASAYGWLAAHAPQFHFIKRYSYEAWHFGFDLGAGTTSVGYGNGDGRGAVPSFVPSRFAPALVAAAQRWNVSAALLAAQLYAESGFNPFAVSPAGAQGIAQMMPATARGLGLANPFDVARAIDAQGHLMRDLLRQFGSVPLALAAYNAGSGAVARCGCIPPYPETQAYVARILGLLRGAGDSGGRGVGLEIRLVR